MKHNLDVFLLFLFIRLVSIICVQTSFVPDEYWQSMEVAHKLVFGYGYLTWEWTVGLRSYIHPLIFAGLYKILKVLDIDYAVLIIYLPRVLQALLSAYSDLCFYRWSGTKKWGILCIGTSWFWFYTGSRTLINTFETSISTIALYKFPWLGKAKDEKLTFIWIVGFICIVRPTATIMWIPLCVYHLIITQHSLRLISVMYFCVGVMLFMESVILDSLAHGKFIVTFYQFLKFNVLQGGASIYGVLPWHWYLSVGIPGILGIQLLPCVLASLVILKQRHSHVNELMLLGTIVFTTFVFSLLQHKEFRFLLPLVPMFMFISSRFLASWSRKAKSLTVLIVGLIILFGNAVPAYYLGMFHQRGTLDIMSPLREIALKNPKETSFLFLMPCHSTPMYSHLHVNVTTRYLTCNPNLKRKKKYIDEADTFYKAPNEWMRKHYPPNGPLPSHIIIFDMLATSIGDVLSRYKNTISIFHSHIPLSSRIGGNVLVFERIDYL